MELPNLSNVDQTAFACVLYSLSVVSPRSSLIAGRKQRDFPRRETIRLDVVPEQQSKWCHSSPRQLQLSWTWESDLLVELTAVVSVGISQVL
jgi:hypothetical protein